MKTLHDVRAGTSQDTRAAPASPGQAALFPGPQRPAQPRRLRTPRAHITPRKHARSASYASECRVAGGLSGGERPRPPREYVNNSADDHGLAAIADDLRRRERLRLRAIVRRISRLKSRPRDGSEPQYSLRTCGHVRISESGNVRLKLVGGTGYVEGVAHCGSIHGCPVCAAKIRNGRAAIYADSAARWLADGNSLFMVTLTFPHDMGMMLAPLWDLVSKGVSSLTSSVAWRELKTELGGEVWYRRAIEQTHGDCGWHPHCHMLVYVRGISGAEGLAALDAYFRARWAAWVTRHGYRLPNLHGVDVKPCYAGGDAGQYIVKTQDGRGIGNELVRSDLKTGRRKGRTPFEILADAGNGDKSSLLLWWEFEQASQGRRAITQSQGLADVLGERDVTDEELADEEAGGEAVADLPGQVWDDVIRNDAEADVFEAVRHGLAAINAVLAANGCGLAYVPVMTERGS